MSTLFGGGPKTASTTPTQAMGIQFNSSQYGPPVPVVYGTAKLGGSCLWYGDFQSTAHSQKTGKGGGGSTTSGYTYSASFQLGLCEGPIAGIGNVYSGTSTVSLSSVGAVIATGTQSQAAWSHLSGAFALGYSQTAVISVANLNLGSSASLPDWNPEVQGLLIQSGSQDSNPANILNDICTNATHGINFPWLGSLTQYSNYCLATGLLLSPCYDQEQTAQQTLEDLFTYTNSAAWFSEGVLKVQPYGDIPVTANGVTYTPNVTPLVNLGEADYIVNPGDAPITVTRKAPADCMNMVRVEFQDRSNTYHTGVVVATIDYDVNTHGGRSDDTENVDMCKSATVARFIAQNMVQRAFYVRNTYEFKLSWRYCYLEPMDIVTLTDANLSLNEWPVRIIEVAEDEGGVLSITAEEFPEGIGHSALYNTQPNNGATIDPNTDPGAVNPPYLFRGPGFLVSNNTPEIWCAVNGANPLWGAADIYMSHDGSSYSYVGTTAQPARYGSLSTALAASAGDPDTTNTPQVTLYAPAVLLGGTQLDADNLNTLAMVDTEIISYETASLVASETYQLSYLRRGAFGSSNVAHSIGAPFVRLDDGVFRIPVDPSQIGQTVYLKFLSINCFGRTPRSLSSETAYTYVIGTNVELPDIPPVPASFAVSPVADGVSITWGNTNPAATGCTSIEYATAAAGPYTVLAQVGPTTTGFTHHFTNGATYWYRARARGPLVQSGWSAYTADVNSYGKTVQNGADVTASQVAAYVLNPSFVNGAAYWSSPDTTMTWAAQSGSTGPYGAPYYMTHGGPGNSVVTANMGSTAYAPIYPGQTFKATVQINPVSSPNGAACIRISWRNASNAEIGSVTGSFITAATGVGTSVAVGQAPAGTATLVVQLIASNHTTAYYCFSNVQYNYQPNSIDEVPDGATRFGAVYSPATQNGIYQPGGNFVYNPMFALGTTYWSMSGWVATAINGGPCAGIGLTTTATTSVCESVQYAIGAGVTLSASLDMLLSSTLTAGDVSADLQYFNSSGTLIGSSNRIFIVSSAASDFARYTLNGVVTPAGTASVAIRAYLEGASAASGAFYVRRMKIEKGAVATPFNDESTQMGNNLTVSGSGQQVGDLRNLSQRVVTNIPAKVPSVISYSASTTSATISVAAFTVLNGGNPVSYNAMSTTVSGSAGTNVTYYLYFNDPKYAGGTVSLIATTNGNDLYQNLGTVYVGPVTVSFPTSGSGSGSGGGGGPGACVCADMLLDHDTQACEATAGYLADCIDIPTSGLRKFRRRLLGMEMSMQPCVRLTTDRGAILECSASTPFDLPSGGMTYAPQMEGLEVMTDKGIETVVSVIDIGEQMVCHQHYGGCSYAAGMDPDHRIYSHNAFLKP